MKWLSRLRSPLTGTLILLCWAEPAAGQAPEPFSTLEILVGGSAPLDIGDLGAFWQANPGIGIRVTAPFYIGIAAAALHTTQFDSLDRLEQPDFRMRTATLEWNLNYRPNRPVSAFAGIQAGAAAMRFQEVEPLTDNADENEFLAGAQAGLNLRIAGGVGATVIASHRQVFTRLPLRLTTIVLGMSYSFVTPGILRDVLE